jgi:hypothetical protein
VTVTGATIKCTAQYAHGAMASGGGTLTLKDVSVATTGANSAAIATDRGSGTVTATGGTFTTSGQDAPGIYSTGKFAVTGGTYIATAAEGAVVEGANSINLTNVTMTGAKNGVMLHQSGSGDAESGTASFTMSGGSLKAQGGDLFYVKNTTGAVTLTGVTVSNSANVINAVSKGKVTLTASGERLSGNVVTDSTSSAALVLSNASTLGGKINKAALTLDATSTWTVTADSTVTSLTGATISGSSISNIVGNGHKVYYSKSASANSYLGAKTYTLSGGGTLVAQ